jgi:hypothetical protein
MPEIGDKRPPIVEYYGAENYILYNDTTIYYFKTDLGFICGTGIESDRMPKRLNLTTDSLVEIKISALEQFISKNGNHRMISVSSPTDTVRNKGIWILQNYIKENSLNRFIRKCTEEEFYVSEAKFRGIDYKPESCEWRIGFEPD